MAWQDRTREAAYTSPSGLRFAFPFLNADRSFDKNTSAYNFPGVKGTYIQDLGNTDRRYPMRVIFWGDDHDLQAEAFEDALIETGRGKLEHPRKGVVDVVPFGTITFREDLVESSNQTIIEIEFWETTATLFPSGSEDASSTVLGSVLSANDASAADFAGGINTETAFQRVSLRDRFDAAVGATRSVLQSVSSAETDVLREFTAIADSIQTGLDTFISQPLALAQQTQALIQTPAKIAGSILGQLDAYGTIVNDLTGGDDPVRSTVNDFKNDELFAMGSVNASILSTVGNEFTTRPEAISAAEAVVAQFEAVNEWREQNYTGLDEVDTGESYAALQEAVSIAAGYLVSLSFSLLQERRIVLGRNRTMVDLVAELYGELDDRFDFFIQTNDLSGDEFIEIPAGREVVYYA